ncbi:hypothetical protein GGP41_001313 [Bipolaris sorokiniana]|uniref:Uncharacterized protein n=2 Tax=Cochliobolus sativus TaxID=45130 RepID=A0A8H6DRL4_COCSA|nr:uncharacterized protein COCSADRAFT_210993 [Bipolaris sorokiniana ND90Pr]EMD69531.1 hypothetical protein COCSADRAFT_210993 [Bipolaris sorokiniana ND90Pr]KAF5845253.1 hypothetical protein GGP41_001313 [Bipolaris sorokiniana]
MHFRCVKGWYQHALNQIHQGCCLLRRHLDTVKSIQCALIFLIISTMIKLFESPVGEAHLDKDNVLCTLNHSLTEIWDIYCINCISG